MRKLLFTLIACALSTGLQAADHGVLRIKGKLQGFGDAVVVTMMTDMRTGTTDTIALKRTAGSTPKTRRSSCQHQAHWCAWRDPPVERLSNGL